MNLWYVSLHFFIKLKWHVMEIMKNILHCIFYSLYYILNLKPKLNNLFLVSRSSIFGNRHFIVFMATIFVTLPLSLYRTIVRLSIVSKFYMHLCIFCYIFIIKKSILYSYTWFFTGIIFILAFCCFHCPVCSIPSIYNVRGNVRTFFIIYSFLKYIFIVFMCSYDKFYWLTNISIYTLYYVIYNLSLKVKWK